MRLRFSNSVLYLLKLQHRGWGKWCRIFKKRMSFWENMTTFWEITANLPESWYHHTFRIIYWLLKQLPTHYVLPLKWFPQSAPAQIEEQEKIILTKAIKFILVLIFTFAVSFKWGLTGSKMLKKNYHITSSYTSENSHNWCLKPHSLSLTTTGFTFQNGNGVMFPFILSWPEWILGTLFSRFRIIFALRYHDF